MRLFDADIMMELVDRLPFRNNEDVKNFIEVQPTVDAEPVRHGRWIDVGSNDDLWRCSVCGELQCCYGRYCSTCGAKMDEVTE